MFTAIVTAIKAAVTLRALIVYGVIAAAVLGFGWKIYSTVYHRGYEAAIGEVAARNTGAMKRVKEQMEKVDNCEREGGNWDPSLGVCH